MEKGSGTAKRETVGRVTKDQVREIAAIKMADLNANDPDGAALQIEGTARCDGHRSRLLAAGQDRNAAALPPRAAEHGR